MVALHTYQRCDRKGKEHLPPASMYLPPGQGILLAPKPIRATSCDQDGNAVAGARKRFPNLVESKPLVMYDGVVEAEELGDQDSQHGEGEGCPDEREICTFQS